MWRTQIKQDSGSSPYIMVFGQEPRVLDERERQKSASISLDELEQIRDAEDNSFTAAVREFGTKRMRERQLLHEEKTMDGRQSVNYEIGDAVYVWNKPLEDQHGKKFESRWLGPFYVTRIEDKGAYVLTDHEGRVYGKGKTYNQEHLKPTRPEYDLSSLLETYETQPEHGSEKEKDVHVFLLDLDDDEICGSTSTEESIRGRAEGGQSYDNSESLAL